MIATALLPSLKPESHRASRTRHLVWSLLLIISFSAAAAEEKLIFSDNFENSSRQSPPPGWTMWGDKKFQVATNFTRDTACAHGGAASLRIHHPANTRGYIVL